MTLQKIDSSQTTAFTAASAFLSPQQKIISIELIGISENVIWKIITTENNLQKILALRVQRPNYRNQKETLSEIAWLKYLNSKGCLTPKPLQVKSKKQLDSENIFTFQNKEGETINALAFEWIDGFAMSLRHAPYFMTEFGKYLSKLHSLSFTGDKANQRREWTPKTILNPDAIWGYWQDLDNLDRQQRTVFSAAEELVKARIATLNKDKSVFKLVHSDTWATNWIYTKNGSLALIDFDDCAKSWIAFDLAACLSFIEHQDNCQQMLADLLTGYLSKSTLPDEMIKEIPTFIMLRRFQLLGWMRTRRESHTAKSMIKTGFFEVSSDLAKHYLKSQGERIWK